MHYGHALRCKAKRFLEVTPASLCTREKLQAMRKKQFLNGNKPLVELLDVVLEEKLSGACKNDNFLRM